MANHIMNKLIISAGSNERVEEILRFIRPDVENADIITNDCNVIDFEKILPSPEELGEFTPAICDWRITHWGTKSNAWGQPHINSVDNEVWFETAWDAPFGVITRLAMLFPDASFELFFMDWGIPENCGALMFENGNCYEIPIDSRLLIIELYGYYPEKEDCF